MVNYSTNDAIISDILTKLPYSSLILYGSLFYIRCCIHILNLIVQNSLSIICKLIENIRESVAFWMTSPKRESKFDEVVNQVGIQSTKSWHNTKKFFVI